MPPLDYKTTIINAINTLTTTQVATFTSIVNIGMAGDLKELEFEEGEEIDFELAHFDGSSDTNIITLVALFRQMEEAKQTLINLNAINEDDLDLILPDE
jgi:hypothetical protein